MVLPTASIHENVNFIGVPEITSSQQLRQLRDIHRNPPRFVFGEQLAADCRSELGLIIDVCELLPVMISHGEIAWVLLNGPGRRKAAFCHVVLSH